MKVCQTHLIVRLGCVLQNLVPSLFILKENNILAPSWHICYPNKLYSLRQKRKGAECFYFSHIFHLMFCTKINIFIQTVKLVHQFSILFCFVPNWHCQPGLLKCSLLRYRSCDWAEHSASLRLLSSAHTLVLHQRCNQSGTMSSRRTQPPPPFPTALSFPCVFCNQLIIW